MAQPAVSEQRMLEEKLSNALEEAWQKVNTALEQTSQRSEKFEMGIWLAAEAVEYSSLLFSLTYGLEDLDPKPREVRSEDPLVLVKESQELLRQARELRERSSVQAYASLRAAGHFLKTAHLNNIKKQTKRSRQSLTRSRVGARSPRR